MGSMFGGATGDGRVRVDDEHSVGAGSADPNGRDAPDDGVAGAVTAILSRVPVVRQDRGHPLGPRSAAGVEDQQQFHEVVLHRRTGRLHDIDVVAAEI
jgi:hypothetical protein